jgi:hypothetical protein
LVFDLVVVHPEAHATCHLSCSYLEEVEGNTVAGLASFGCAAKDSMSVIKLAIRLSK